MNKAEYFAALNAALSELPSSEREEIIRDQEEHISEALRSGREESEVIRSLGSPSNLAKELRVEQQIQAATRETKLISKTDKVFRAIFALCILAPFNIIVVLGPFLTCCAILLTMWVVGFSGFATGALIFGLSFLVIPVSVAAFFTALFGSISGMGASLLFMIACYIFTLWFLKFTLWYLNKNLEVVTGEVST